MHKARVGATATRTAHPPRISSDLKPETTDSTGALFSTALGDGEHPKSSLFCPSTPSPHRPAPGQDPRSPAPACSLLPIPDASSLPAGLGASQPRSRLPALSYCLWTEVQHSQPRPQTSNCCPLLYGPGARPSTKVNPLTSLHVNCCLPCGVVQVHHGPPRPRQGRAQLL